MSEVFFSDLDLVEPTYNLNINGGTHGAMTGRMLTEAEKVMMAEKPDIVLVYGDTNSTLAGSLAAVKLHIPVAHVEAGLRSFHMAMPEEVNRILTDQISEWLFCPTERAMENLRREGFASRPVKIFQVGDVMQDAAIFFSPLARRPKELAAGIPYILATLHRAENTDDPTRLGSILSALNRLQKNVPVVVPLHPRTRAAIRKMGLDLDCHVLDPVGYLEILWLLDHCCLVVTDSGGMQKEAFFFGKPCVTTRDQTEWTELVEMGANALAGTESTGIVTAAERMIGRKIDDVHSLYGGGRASERIVEKLAGM
jgi:UDP-GlcNAc3NAcA epimerase